MEAGQSTSGSTTTEGPPAEFTFESSVRFVEPVACFCLKRCLTQMSLHDCVLNHVVEDFARDKKCQSCSKVFQKDGADIPEHVEFHVKDLMARNPNKEEEVKVKKMMKEIVKMGSHFEAIECPLCRRSLAPKSPASQLLLHIVEKHPGVPGCEPCKVMFGPMDRMKPAMHFAYYHHEELRKHIEEYVKLATSGKETRELLKKVHQAGKGLRMSSN